MKNPNTESSKKQLLLFEPFLDSELTCTNEFLTYIDTTSNNSKIVHKNSATSSHDDIRKSLKFSSHVLFQIRLTRLIHNANKNNYTTEQIESLKQKKINNKRNYAIT